MKWIPFNEQRESLGQNGRRPYITFSITQMPAPKQLNYYVCMYLCVYLPWGVAPAPIAASVDCAFSLDVTPICSVSVGLLAFNGCIRSYLHSSRPPWVGAHPVDGYGEPATACGLQTIGKVDSVLYGISPCVYVVSIDLLHGVSIANTVTRSQSSRQGP